MKLRFYYLQNPKRNGCMRRMTWAFCTSIPKLFQEEKNMKRMNTYIFLLRLFLSAAYLNNYINCSVFQILISSIRDQKRPILLSIPPCKWRVYCTQVVFPRYPSSCGYRGLARIFSEVRTILQITFHPTPPPKKKKLSWLKIWLRCKPNSFFSPYEMTLATYEILCQVFGSIY